LLANATLLEAEVRASLGELMPLEHAPAHLRLAFHDAGTFDSRTNTGGVGRIHLADQLRRGETTGWGHACFELLGLVKDEHPQLSWADLVAVGGAAAVQKCGGPSIEIGLGREDQSEPAPAHRLPGGAEGAVLVRALFTRMGLSVQELVALSGAHTLGHVQRRPFTADPWVFSNSYYVQLLAQAGGQLRLNSDDALLGDAEMRGWVERYAADEALFFEDFAAAYRRLTWLGASSGGS
jgi:L-ascorbate peroxidase